MRKIAQPRTSVHSEAHGQHAATSGLWVDAERSIGRLIKQDYSEAKDAEPAGLTRTTHAVTRGQTIWRVTRAMLVCLTDFEAILACWRWLVVQLLIKSGPTPRWTVVDGAGLAGRIGRGYSVLVSRLAQPVGSGAWACLGVRDDQYAYTFTYSTPLNKNNCERKIYFKNNFFQTNNQPKPLHFYNRCACLSAVK